MHPTVEQIEQARAIYTEQWQRASCASVHDPAVRHHVDVLLQAMQECDLQIRDRKLASVVHQQREYVAGLDHAKVSQ